jgi:AraC-like DNA-binding protein
MKGICVRFELSAMVLRQMPKSLDQTAAPANSFKLCAMSNAQINRWSANRFWLRRTLRPGVVRVDANLTDFAFPQHFHEHVCLGLMHDGAYSSRYGLRRYAVQAGDVIFVAPGEVHDGRPLGMQGRAYSMLEIEPAAYRALCLATTGQAWVDFPSAVAHERQTYRALGAWLRALVGSDPADELAAATLLFGAVSPCAQSELLSVAAERGLANQARQAMEAAEHAFDSIAAIAAGLGASRFQLIRAFKRAFGETPEAFRRNWRVRCARLRLAEAEDLAAVAASAGFADQAHMTREFRRVTGITPGAYRRALLDS